MARSSKVEAGEFVSRNLAGHTPPAANILLMVLTVALGGCKTFEPERIDPAAVASGLQTKSIENVAVSAAILLDDQAQRHFGVDLAMEGVQALWISVSNASPQKLWFVRNTVDRDFFSADETALLARKQIPDKKFDLLRQYLRDESMRVLIQPNTITEGFVFLPRVEGGRYVDIRLARDAYEAKSGDALAPARAAAPEPGTFSEIRFGFALPLPDGQFDFERLDPDHTYRGMDLPNLDTLQLRTRLEEMACCATDKDEKNSGDPINVVIIGDAADVLNSLSRCGWSFTHRITWRSVRRMIGSAIQGEAYPVAPVSSLYLFGRRQDFALQRARLSLAQRNHMRFWMAPFLHEDRQVWVGQVSRDIGIKITSRSPSLTTHIIDPEVDLTREYLLHSLLAEGFVERFGFVKGSKHAPQSDPATNLTGDSYFSDGMRLVMMLSPEPVPYDEVQSLRWERSEAPVAEGQSDEAHRYVRPLE